MKTDERELVLELGWFKATDSERDTEVWSPTGQMAMHGSLWMVNGVQIFLVDCSSTIVKKFSPMVN